MKMQMRVETALVFLVAVLLLAVIVEGQVPGDIRLVRYDKSNITFNYGRLQIYGGGAWGEICSDGFGSVEADVACHQLGFAYSLNITTNGSYGTPINVKLSEVSCPSSDYLHLLRCLYSPLPRCINKPYVTLQCSSSHIWDNPYEGQLRLVYGNYTSMGLALVYCNGQWGTLCASSYSSQFDKTAADTVCRQLGYTRAVDYNHVILEVQNYSTPIWLDSYSCPSTRAECLGACSVCSHSESSSCSHYSDLKIQCGFESLHYDFGSNISTCDYYEGGYKQYRPRMGEVRLTNGSLDDRRGIVGVVYGSDTTNADWIRVCAVNPSYNRNNSQTICQQLYYSYAIDYYTVPSDPAVYHLNVRCMEPRPHILQCQYDSSPMSCDRALVIQCAKFNITYYTGQLRLVGGEYPSEGKLEIYVHNQWAGVVSHYYYENYKIEADSACRQLGYTGAISGIKSDQLSGYYNITYYDPYCGSPFPCLTNCLSLYNFEYYYGFYYYGGNLFINCTFDVNNKNVTFGSESLCSISQPPLHSPYPPYPPTIPPIPPTVRAGVVVGSVVFLIIFVACFASTICCICCCVHLHKRHIIKTQKAVKYTSEGKTVTIIQEGVVFVPAGSQTHQVNVPIDDDNEKKQPLNEYTPAPSTIM